MYGGGGGTKAKIIRTKIKNIIFVSVSDQTMSEKINFNFSKFNTKKKKKPSGGTCVEEIVMR